MDEKNINEREILILNKEKYTHTLNDIQVLEKNKKIKVVLVGQEDKENEKYAIYDVLLKKSNKFTLFKSEQSDKSYEKIKTIYINRNQLF